MRTWEVREDTAQMKTMKTDRDVASKLLNNFLNNCAQRAKASRPLNEGRLNEINSWR